jgi:hypothetical protein
VRIARCSTAFRGADARATLAYERASVNAVIGSIPRSFRVLSDYRAKGYDLGSFTGS